MRPIPDLAQKSLKEYIDRYVSLHDQEFSGFCDVLEHQQVQKKQFILEAGHICKHQYFILTGCFRSFYIDPKGNEQVLHFGIENWWMTEYDSFNNQTASEVYIQALEDSRVLKISHDNLDRLCKEVPKIEKLFRIIAEKTFIAAQNRLKYMLSLRREKMLDEFTVSTSPFSNRVPQYMIASYLGFTPEFMSMIRARRRKKDQKK